jgi:hypothetical protein
MKFNNILFASFIILSSIIIACNSSSNVNIDYNKDLCGLHDYRSGDSLQIMNSKCAIEHIENYSAQLNTLKDSLSNPSIFHDLLIRGARLSLTELEHIHAVAQANQDSFVYIMMASDSTGSASMIFAFENHLNIHPDNFTFFNFTRPCPDACPTL